MSADNKEAHLMDEFPTKNHMTTGRNNDLNLYCSHVKLGLFRHLARLKIDPAGRQHPVSHRSHPKVKKFGAIDKKNLYDI